MPGNPTLAQVHVDQPLSNILIGHFQEKPSLARRVFGVVPVDKITNSYFIWNKGDLMRNDARVRAPGTKPAEFNFRTSTDTYRLIEYALRKALTDELEANADFDVRAAITKALGTKIMISESIRFASTYLTTGVWGTDNTLLAGAQWSDSTSTPIANVRTAKRTIKSNTGYTPNVMVLGDQVADVLVEHVDIRGRMALTEYQNVNTDDREAFLSRVFGLKVVIADEVYNTAAEGQTASLASIVGDTVLVAYMSPSPAVNEPSAGYVFSWKGFDGGGSVRVYPDGDPGLKTTWLEANSFIDMKVVSTDCGYIFADVLA